MVKRKLGLSCLLECEIIFFVKKSVIHGAKINNCNLLITFKLNSDDDFPYKSDLRLYAQELENFSLKKIILLFTKIISLFILWNHF